MTSTPLAHGDAWLGFLHNLKQQSWSNIPHLSEEERLQLWTQISETTSNGTEYEKSTEDVTLTSVTSSDHGSRLEIDDWSQSGHGSHVDFGDDDTVPLEQGATTPKLLSWKG
jgi:hypothetical protein